LKIEGGTATRTEKVRRVGSTCGLSHVGTMIFGGECEKEEEENKTGGPRDMEGGHPCGKGEGRG
jgi:hypothetical protein